MTAATRLATTSASSLVLPDETAPVDYFLVVAIDRASAVSATSGCLTAGTTARAAIGVDLRDSLGHPLEGLTVTMETTAGLLGPVEPAGGTYRAVLAAPAIDTGPAVVSVAAEGAALDTSPVIDVAPPLGDAPGGAGGCAADGNLRVRVVDEQGQPLAEAHVMVGQAEAFGVYQTTPGGPFDGGNTGLTDGAGYVEFLDFGPGLDGPQTVTAAADGRRYATLLDVDAADLALPLPPVAPTTPAETFFGDVTNIPTGSCDTVDFGVVLPDVALEAVLGLNADELLADDVCYASNNGLVGTVALPGNLYLPAQSIASFCLGGSIAEKEYLSAPVGAGERRLLALRGLVHYTALDSGDFVDVLLDPSFALNGIGVVGRAVSGSGSTRLDLPITQTLSANLRCTIDGAPAASEVFCAAAGDWDSALDPALTPASGRLFLMGLRLGDTAGATGPTTIGGVTTVARTGDFAGIDYVGGAIALYNDPAKPGIPPGTEDGTSAIFERSGAAFDGSGGALAFTDFFPIRTMSRAGRDFALSALPGAGHPAPHLGRATIDQVITERARSISSAFPSPPPAGRARRRAATSPASSIRRPRRRTTG